jgi:hypothetical protein
MDREWQELDIENVPSDLFKPGAWEYQYFDGEDWNIIDFKTVYTTPYVFNKMKSRIRRPEGLEPSECPNCGSNFKQSRPPFCRNEWHDQPKEPTHEEIMAPRYWKDNRGRWKQILAYHPDSEHGPYVIDGDGRSASWFINRESADIPPE